MKKAFSFLICTVMFVSILISMPSFALADEAEPSPSPSPTPAPAPVVTSRYALLGGIDVTAGTWNKEFSAGVRSYVLTLGETEEGVTITPIKGDETQTITISGRRVGSAAVNPDHGKHRHITIRVRQPGKRSRLYRVKVAREKSSDNDLAALSFSVGTMEGEFDPATLEYNVALDQYSPFVKVTAAKANNHATLRIDGYRRTWRNYTVPPGTEKTVTITVRSQTRVTKTYLIHLRREAYPITDKAEALIDFAKYYIGKVHYVSGGKSPAGFDCSGFVYYCLNGIGYTTGYRTSGAWAKSGFKTISKLEQMLPGDILCFKGHVGIYMGDNMMIDCAYSLNGVTIKSCVTPYWRENFICGKRVFVQETPAS